MMLHILLYDFPLIPSWDLAKLSLFSIEINIETTTRLLSTSLNISNYPNNAALRAAELHEKLIFRVSRAR